MPSKEQNKTSLQMFVFVYSAGKSACHVSMIHRIHGKVKGETRFQSSPLTSSTGGLSHIHIIIILKII